ncbi:MAG: class I SAM-dependent methyltransferase [Chloroflexi bacterium]|nr:MAG: class I SAM-dependent methyltransferase [Chloroflexota bacterium]
MDMACRHRPRRWPRCGYVTGDRFDVVQCRRCGFATTHPVPASLDRYYPPRYRRFNPFAAFVLHYLYLRRVGGWVARLGPSGLALEIGSGTGWMLRALRERGWRVVGSERSAEAAAASRAAAGVPMFAGDLEAVRPAPVLDLIIMFHVLEHLADPLAALRAAAARLRPGGTLVLGLPNNASWQARVAGSYWMHLDVPRHLCHFSPDTIERALSLTGFRLIRITFRSFEHDPLGWIQSGLDALGFEQGFVLKRLVGMHERRSGPLATLGAYLVALPLGVISVPLALASWPARAGAVMEVWAVREGPNVD